MTHAEIDSFGRMYWHWVHYEMYGPSMAEDKLRAYGLTDGDIARIVRYADTHTDEWDICKRRFERQG